MIQPFSGTSIFILTKPSLGAQLVDSVLFCVKTTLLLRLS